jgi:large subunit ribosomal protein L9
MKIILKQDIKGSGKKGDVIEVNDGYARNFLIKKNMAEEATPAALNGIKQKKRAEQFKIEQEKKEAFELRDRLNNAEIILKLRHGENGKLFGSVTSKEICEELIKAGFNIDKKAVILDAPIKTFGRHIVEVRVYPETTAKLKINIVNL